MYGWPYIHALIQPSPHKVLFFSTETRMYPLGYLNSNVHPFALRTVTRKPQGRDLCWLRLVHPNVRCKTGKTQIVTLLFVAIWCALKLDPLKSKKDHKMAISRSSYQIKNNDWVVIDGVLDGGAIIMGITTDRSVTETGNNDSGVNDDATACLVIMTKGTVTQELPVKEKFCEVIDGDGSGLIIVRIWI